MADPPKDPKPPAPPAENDKKKEPDEEEVRKYVAQFEADHRHNDDMASALDRLFTMPAIQMPPVPGLDFTPFWAGTDPSGAWREAFRRVHGTEATLLDMVSGVGIAARAKGDAVVAAPAPSDQTREMIGPPVQQIEAQQIERASALQPAPAAVVRAVAAPPSHEPTAKTSDDDPVGSTSKPKSDYARLAKESRAMTVAKLIMELDQLKPQMFEDETEYERLRGRYPDYLSFKIAENRDDLRRKILSIRGSPRHIRLAQELAAAHFGRALSTLQDDWKDHKPGEYRRQK